MESVFVLLLLPMLHKIYLGKQSSDANNVGIFLFFSSFLVSFQQDHSESAVGVAATMAHEMGHNFGMSHDTSDCCQASADDGGCIMAAATGYETPVTAQSPRASLEKRNNSNVYFYIDYT